MIRKLTPEEARRVRNELESIPEFESTGRIIGEAIAKGNTIYVWDTIVESERRANDAEREQGAADRADRADEEGDHVRRSGAQERSTEAPEADAVPVEAVRPISGGCEAEGGVKG